MAINPTDLDSRERELRALLEEAEKRLTMVQEELAELNEQLGQLKIARSALARAGLLELSNETIEAMNDAGDPSERGGEVDRPAGEATETSQRRVQDILAEVLAEGPLWWSAVQIRGRASEIADRDVPMSTVSPTLTKMKNEGEIVRDGVKKIALRSRVAVEAPSFLEENGEAAASPDAEASQTDPLLGLKTPTTPR